MQKNGILLKEDRRKRDFYKIKKFFFRMTAAVNVYGYTIRKRSFTERARIRDMETGKAERMLTLYRLLSRGEVVSKSELADQMGVDGRTIQRDIDDLRAYLANISASSDLCPSIVYDRKRKGFLFDDSGEKMKGSQLLTVCKILLESRALVKEELEPILYKLIANCAPQTAQKQVLELIANERFHYLEPNHQMCLTGRLWEMGEAVKSQRYVRMEYRKLGGRGTVNRMVKPVGVMFSEFYFYLIAFIVREDECGGEKEPEYLSPAIYRLDRIVSYQVLDRHFSIPYRERFEEGEFRKRVQFMYGGELKRIVFEYSGPSLEAVLDRLPTAKVLEHTGDSCKIQAEVFGDGIDMWLRSQGDYVKVISKSVLKE